MRDDFSRAAWPKPREMPDLPPVPPPLPNETAFCRFCERETEHTVSDFCGRKMRLCTGCGEMRSKRTDARPFPSETVGMTVHEIPNDRRDLPAGEPRQVELDLYGPNDVVPDFGQWYVMRVCSDCMRLTSHARSLQQVSHGWVFRCRDCGKIVSAGSR